MSPLFGWGIPFRQDGEFGQLGRGDADALEALGHDAVGSGEQGNQQIHRRDVIAAVIAGAALGITQQPDHIVGQEFAIEEERWKGFSILLVEKFAKLIEEARQISAEFGRPFEDAGIGSG